MKKRENRIQESDTLRRNSASTNDEKPVSVQKNVLAYLHDLVYLLAGVLLVLLLLFRVVIVDGPSMNDTLVHGDYLLLLNNVFYGDPKQGDIIVASKKSFDNGSPIIKRVIATEGQTVDIDFVSGVVYVDGVALDESYTLTSTHTREGMDFPLTVSEGCLFVMGDNRNHSTDSRTLGFVPENDILGKVFADLD